MRGPEIRIGNLREPIKLSDGDSIKAGCEGIPVTDIVVNTLECGEVIRYLSRTAAQNIL